jgi:signal transduction histidine kinase
VVFTGWVWTLPGPNGLPPLSLAQDSAGVLSWGGLGVAWAVTGAVLVTVRPRNALGWLLLVIGLSQAWHVGLVTYAIHGLTVADNPWPGALWAGYIGAALFVVGVLATPTLLLALYPQGRLPGKWWRWPVGVAAVAVVHIAVQGLFLVVGSPRVGQVVVVVPDFLQGIPSRLLPPAQHSLQPVWTTDERLPRWAEVIRDDYLPIAGQAWVPLFVLSMLVIWVGTVIRLLRTRPPQRQQLACLVCIVMPFLVASWLAPSVARPLTLLMLLLVPVSVAIGVLRYRLLNIETVLRRGLVYGTLTVLVFGVYLTVTALAGKILESDPLPGVVAAALVAVGLAPARDRLQRGADRLVYGERRDPLRAINRLAQRVAATGEQELLQAALASVADAVRAPGVAVAYPDGRIVGSVGVSAAGTVVPLEFGGRHVGELRVAAPGPGQRYTDAGLRLLAVLAPQIAVIVRAHELTEALEAERDRVLAATTTERDRLRRDLHDGLGPSLSGVGLGLQALTDALHGADTAAVALVDRIRAEVAIAVDEVRRIIDNLRPAALDTRGLREAIRCHAETVSATLPVDVDAADLPAISPEVENAAYRITTEAITNAARHAAARHVQVTVVAASGTLRITVADDGQGGACVRAGVGLTSMRRRAEALGGHLDVASAATGTTITASLPLRSSDDRVAPGPAGHRG